MRVKAVGLIAFSLVAVLAITSAASAQASGDPTPADRWLEVDYEISLTEHLQSLTLDGDVSIHEVPSNSATAFHCGNSCSADELRELYQSSGDERKKQLVEALETRIADSTREVLEAISGDPDANATADVDESALESPAEDWAYAPAIPATVTGDADIARLEDAGYSSSQIDALFRMGARISVPINATVDPGTNLTLTLTVPEPLAVLDASNADPSSTDRAVTWTVTNWKAPPGASKTLEDEILMGRTDVVVPSRERIDLDIVLDLSNVDAHYLQALTGGPPATLNAELNVDGSIRSVATPTELDGVELPFLSADALRIGIENDLIESEQLTSFEDEARTSVREAFTSLAGEQVPVSGGFVPATLDAASIGEPPGTGAPILFDMAAESELTIPPEQGATTGASAFEITRFGMGSFELPSIPTPGDRPANVTVILPEGVGLAFETASGANVTRSTTEDGRTAITFTTSSDGRPTMVQGAEVVVNHPIVWNLFWPVLVFLVLVLVVLPGAIIAYVVRKRRRETRGVNQERRSPVRGGYADQSSGDDPGDASEAAPGDGGERSGQA